jgi:hypothetical protein
MNFNTNTIKDVSNTEGWTRSMKISDFFQYLGIPKSDINDLRDISGNGWWGLGWSMNYFECIWDDSALTIFNSCRFNFKIKDKQSILDEMDAIDKNKILYWKYYGNIAVVSFYVK